MFRCNNCHTTTCSNYRIKIPVEIIFAGNGPQLARVGTEVLRACGD